MSEHHRDEAYYQTLLYGLLPALYRGRDGSGELGKFLDLFGHEFARQRANLDRLLRDVAIDSCQDWVVPYLGDLVGTSILFNEAARNRADVRNTIKWRRRKGTLPGLEDIAAVIADRGALAVEMFERLIWSQRLNHLRRRALHTANLADGTRLSRLRTPFDPSCRTLDLRPPDHQEGRHHPRRVAFFLSAIPSRPWRGATPATVGGGRFRFHPLGVDCPLYSGGDKGGACEGPPADPQAGPDLCFPHETDVPIRGRDFRDHPLRSFGQPAGFSLYEDGILLCRTAGTAPSRSTTPAGDFQELAAAKGLIVADQGLFGGGAKPFRIAAVRLGAKTTVVDGQPTPVPYSPANPFAVNFGLDGVQGRVETDTFAYTKGLPFNAGAPDYHHRALLLRIERLGADPNFPECEVIVRNARGFNRLAFLPAIAGLPAGQPLFLYMADDGATYFARAAHDPGPPDRNPDSALFGAYLPRHLARGSEGQVRPRPGLRPVAHRTPVYRNLCCWDRPLQKPLAPGEVAFDPERGRFLFPAGEVPTGALTVDFRFPMTGEVGAGPYARGELPAATLTVAKEADADHRTIQAAIDAAPNGSPAPVVIQVQDSRTYAEALTVVNRNFPGGLVIQAGVLAIPVVRSPGGAALAVAGTSGAGSLTVDGLVLAGGPVTVHGDVPRVTIRFSSLVPVSSGLTLGPTQAGAELTIRNCLVGPVTASANVARVLVADSILHHPAATPDRPDGQKALTAVHGALLDRSTILGEVAAGRLDASNCLLVGAIVPGDAAGSCARYSRLRQPSPPIRTFRTAQVRPVLQSVRFGAAGYFHVHPASADALRRGGEEGGEMGAFYRAGGPWREQNVRIKLDEYLPAGLRAVVVPVLPVLPFAGARAR